MTTRSFEIAAHDERIGPLEGRCTPLALEFLSLLSNAPEFPQLVAALDKIEGPIFRLDVEDALALARRRRSN